MVLISMPYNAFFDESGTHDQSDIVAVGGLLGSYESWVAAELEWDRVLKFKDIKVLFHFTDFMARDPRSGSRIPPWNWPDSERNDFMERLTTIIGENITLGIAVGIFKKEYSRLSKGLRREFKDIYHCCTYCCLDALVKWKANFTGPALPTPIEFLFDRKPKFEGHAVEIYYKVVKDVDRDGMLGDMGFASKDGNKPIPLQMADLFVGASVRHFRRQRQFGLDVAYEKSMSKMDTNNRLMPLWLREEELTLIMRHAKGAKRST
jgi:Protein of unknown function (DUF3800)